MRAVNCTDVLQHELPGIPAGSIVMTLIVESDHVVAFRQKRFRPSTEPAIEIYDQGLHALIPPRRNSRAAQTDSRTSSYRNSSFEKIIKRISWFICLEYGLFCLAEGNVKIHESRKNVLLNLN